MQAGNYGLSDATAIIIKKIDQDYHFAAAFTRTEFFSNIWTAHSLMSFANKWVEPRNNCLSSREKFGQLANWNRSRGHAIFTFPAFVQNLDFSIFGFPISRKKCFFENLFVSSVHSPS